MIHGKFCRIEQGLTTRELAKRAKVNYSELSRVENGRVNPRPDEVACLAQVLGIEPTSRFLDHVADFGNGIEYRDAQGV